MIVVFYFLNHSEIQRNRFYFIFIANPFPLEMGWSIMSGKSLSFPLSSVPFRFGLWFFCFSSFPGLPFRRESNHYIYGLKDLISVYTFSFPPIGFVLLWEI